MVACDLAVHSAGGGGCSSGGLGSTGKNPCTVTRPHRCQGPPWWWWLGVGGSVRRGLSLEADLAIVLPVRRISN